MWSLLILINFHLNKTKKFYLQQCTLTMVQWSSILNIQLEIEVMIDGKYSTIKIQNCWKWYLWRKKLNEIYLTFFLCKVRMKKMSLNNIKMRTGVLLTMIDFFRITFTIHYFNAKVLASLVIVVRVKDPIEIKTHFSLMQ